MSASPRPRAAGERPQRKVGERLASGARRLGRAWGASGGDQRLAAAAALALFASMFLPWYGETIVQTGSGRIQHENIRAFGSQFSFVEAAVLLVAAGVLFMLFARAERKAFHLPGGDGPVIFAAGAWVAILIFYRMLDTPHTSRNAPQVITDVGLKWGIFFALAAAVTLAFAGWRVRAAHRPEPPLGDERPAPAPPPTAVTRRLDDGRADPPDGSTPQAGQLSLDVAAPRPDSAEAAPGPTERPDSPAAS